MAKKVVVIGGGVAGMQTALSLAQLGIEAVILEKNASLGGKVADWHKLFPTFTPSADVLGPLRRELSDAGIEVRHGAEAEVIHDDGVTLKDGDKIYADATVICSGFELFDAHIKEEYGYGIYDNVVTSTDLERMFNEGKVSTTQGTAPKRVAFLHCVGSRDEKVAQHHCSKVCCITGVKQAMEMREMFPDAEVYNFYMDIRMFGPGYEELYREAQLKSNIHFIRGRISEASQTIDKRIQVKAEDTLIGRPLKMTVDMLILLVGMVGGRSNTAFTKNGKLKVAENGFMSQVDPFLGNVSTGLENIFYAGAVTAPKNVGESLNEGRAAAMKVASYLNNKG